MTSILRLKGRRLMIGNTALMTLFFTVGITLITCINMGVLTYEAYLRESLRSFAGTLITVADILLPMLIILLTRLIWLQVRLGADRYYFRLAEEKGGRPSDIFYYFHPLRAAETALFKLKIAFIKLPVLLLAVLPSILCLVLLSSLSYDGVSSLVALFLAVGGAVLLVNGIALYRRFSALLFLCDYIFIKGEYVSFRQLLSVSLSVMKKEARRLFRLRRSFYGWFMLCTLIFPVGYVWNYYRQTLAVAAAKFLED